MLLEPLESRLPLAAPTDLAAIAGLVFVDQTGDGYTPGEEVSGATVSLYRDNGDGAFNASTDSLVGSVVTTAEGRYRFDRVVAGNYFVRQTSQTVGGRPLSETVSPLIRVEAGDVIGSLFTTIDSFDVADQFVNDTVNDGIAAFSAMQGDPDEILGGWRRLMVNLNSSRVGSEIRMRVGTEAGEGYLSFGTIDGGTGRRVVFWDGQGGNSSIVNDTGLGAVDLTRGGLATGFRLDVGADLAGGTAIVRVYSDDGVGGTANRFSTGQVAIGVTDGIATIPEFLPFTAFSATGGGVDFTRVGAIEFEITGAANVDGVANLVGAIGPTVRTFDFANFQQADLSLSMTVNSGSVGVGSNATFTISARNDGPNAASGVAVSVPLPAGLSFASATASQGSYDAGSGIWTVGGIANSSVATLTLIAAVNTTATTTVTAEISASDQLDPDSTPGNNVPGEDDQASVTISGESADLSLAMVVDDSTPEVGQEVLFTLTLDNAGPSTATGVRVGVPGAGGMTLVSTAASQGTVADGVWNVGMLAAGQNATLVARVRIDTAGVRTVTAEVIASDQPDPNSTPGNNIIGENDQASVTVSVLSADLSLIMAVDNPTPNVGSEVAFTITTRNAGPDPTTGVTVRAALPIGMQFVSATLSPGGGPANYDAATGVWTIGEMAAGNQPALRLVTRPTVAGPLTLTAQVLTSDVPDPNSTPGNNDPSEDDQASVTISAQSADLSLQMIVDNPMPNRGDQVQLTVTLANAGPSTATGIQVRSQLPAGLTLRTATPSTGNYNSSTGTWSVPSLAAGTSATLVFGAFVETASSVTVVAEVIAADQPDPDSTPGNNDPSEDDQASVTIQVRAADLSLTNLADNRTPNVGDEVRFAIVVANAGPDAATGVAVSALLPAGLTLVSAIPSQGTYAAGTGRWTVGSINPALNASLQVVARVETSGDKSFKAEVIESDQIDPNSTPGNNVESEDDQQTVVISPTVIDLALTMTADRTKALIGQPVTFTLRLTNAGPSLATGIAVHDQLPEGLTFLSALSSVGSYDPATSLWTLPSLAVGAVATLELVARFDLPRTLTVTAEVFAADQFDSNSTPNNNVPTENDQASVVIQPETADLVLVQTVSDSTPNLGESVTLTVTVNNQGPDAATGVTVRNLLPPELSLVSATPSRGTYNAATGIWTIGEIANGQGVTLQLIVTPIASGDIVSTAEVATADQFDPNSTPGNNVPGENDQASVTITPQLIDLSLDLQISNALPNVNQTVTYQLILNNAGPSTATGVQVGSQLPPIVRIISTTPTSGNFNAATGIWTVGSVGPGAAARLTIIAQVIEPGSGVATAEVIAADQPDIDSTPNNQDPTEDDFASVVFNTPVADLSLLITVDDPTPDRNQTITFTITVNNSGPDDATGIVVTNRLPSNFNFSGSSASTGVYTPSAGTWVIPALAAGQSATLSYSGRATNLAPITNTAEITRADQSDPDSTPGNADPDEDDIDTVVVIPNVIDLQVFGEIDNLKPDVGDVVTLTFDVVNSGPAIATGVELELALPPGVTTLVFGASQGLYTPGTGIWLVGAMAPGQVETLVVQLSVDVGGIKLATLQVIAADQFDIDSTPGNGIEGEDDQVTLVINAPRLLNKRLFLAR